MEDIAKNTYAWNPVHEENEDIIFELVEEQEKYNLNPTLPFKTIPYAQDKVFKFSFDISLNSGVLNAIGGHNHMSANQMLMIDGNRVQGANTGGYDLAWNMGADLDIDVGETVHIDFLFIAGRFDNPIDGNGNMYVSIEPNRVKNAKRHLHPKQPFKATISNLTVYEGTELIIGTE